jgi:hypothetical protein
MTRVKDLDAELFSDISGVNNACFSIIAEVHAFSGYRYACKRLGTNEE